MEKILSCFKSSLSNLISISLDPDFYLKLISLGLTIITSLFWRIPDAGYSGMDGHFQELLFAHTVPGYLTVMFGLVVTYILGDRPTKWFYYVFYGVGIVLLVVVGLFGVYNCLLQNHDWGTPPLMMALCNLATASVMTIDLFWSTSLFGVCDMAKARLDRARGQEGQEGQDTDRSDAEKSGTDKSEDEGRGEGDE